MVQFPLRLSGLTTDGLNSAFNTRAKELNGGLKHHGVLSKVGTLGIGIDRVAIECGLKWRAIEQIW
jgi:hypothetical protein